MVTSRAALGAFALATLPACARYVVTTEVAMRDPWAASVVRREGDGAEEVVLPAEARRPAERRYGETGLFGTGALEAHRDASGVIWMDRDDADPQTLVGPRGVVVSAYDYALGFDVLHPEPARLHLLVPYESVVGDGLSYEPVSIATPWSNIVYVRERRDPMHPIWPALLLGSVLAVGGGALAGHGLLHAGFEGGTRAGLVGLGTGLVVPGIACIVWALSSLGASTTERVLYGTVPSEP